jgi:hypothetical protein
LPKLLYLQPIGDALYDALVSINVPSDKARAVVDAMERDMGTTLATKQDLEMLKLATRQDLELLRQELRQEFQLLQKDMDGRFALVDQKFDSLELRLVVKLGSLMAVGFGLTIAVL